MTDSQIQPGSSVESMCKKCKTVTDHHVVVMAGDKIAKVECKVCNARHAYASPKAEPKVRARARDKETVRLEDDESLDKEQKPGKKNRGQ